MARGPAAATARRRRRSVRRRAAGRRPPSRRSQRPRRTSACRMRPGAPRASSARCVPTAGRQHRPSSGGFRDPRRTAPTRSSAASNRSVVLTGTPQAAASSLSVHHGCSTVNALRTLNALPMAADPPGPRSRPVSSIIWKHRCIVEACCDATGPLLPLSTACADGSLPMRASSVSSWRRCRPSCGRHPYRHASRAVCGGCMQYARPHRWCCRLHPCLTQGVAVCHQRRVVPC